MTTKLQQALDEFVAHADADKFIQSLVSLARGADVIDVRRFPGGERVAAVEQEMQRRRGARASETVCIGYKLDDASFEVREFFEYGDAAEQTMLETLPWDRGNLILWGQDPTTSPFFQSDAFQILDRDSSGRLGTICNATDWCVIGRSDRGYILDFTCYCPPEGLEWAFSKDVVTYFSDLFNSVARKAVLGVLLPHYAPFETNEPVLQPGHFCCTTTRVSDSALRENVQVVVVREEGTNLLLLAHMLSETYRMAFRFAKFLGYSKWSVEGHERKNPRE